MVSGSVSEVERPVVDALPYKAEHIEAIRRAMHGVTQQGTSTRVFAGAPYASGGKTGTAQAVTIRQNEKYNASKLSEYQRDHSLYVAFAPLQEPTIALALIVENAGFGSAAAAPIARRVFDYWIDGLWPNEEDLLATQRGQTAAPMGAPRRAVEVALPGAAPPEPLVAPAEPARAVEGRAAVRAAGGPAREAADGAPKLRTAQSPTPAGVRQ